MKVSEFMSRNLITVDAGTSILDAQEIMRKNRIKRLPVMQKGKFVGLVTRHMLMEAAPSTATTLSIYELNYLLSKMRVEDIMVKNPRTIPPNYPVEAAIWLGKKYGIGAFPVVEGDKLVGIITESDITNVLSKVMGLEAEGTRITIEGLGRMGELKEIIQVLDDNRTLLLSIVTIPREGGWIVVLRVQGTGARSEEVVKGLEKKGFKVTDVT